MTRFKMIRQDRSIRIFIALLVVLGSMRAAPTLADRRGATNAGALTTPVISWSSGIQMISLPYAYPSTTLDALFGYASPKLAVWNPLTSTYSVSPTPPADQMSLGQGYWVRFPQAVTINQVGTPPTAGSSFDVPLQAGWNMVGDPWTAPVPLSSLLFDSGTISYSEAESSPNQLIGNAWGFNQSADAYFAATSLETGQGYWLYAYSSTDMQIPPNTIGGTMNTTDFMLPAGQTVTVTGNLTINDSDSIEIDGTMLVNPGVNVTLICPNNLVINGNMIPAPPPESPNIAIRKPMGVVGDIIDSIINYEAGNVTIGPTATVTGNPVNIGSQPHGAIGQSLESHITIAGTIIGTAGITGSPGTNGGGVEIGTAAAKAAISGSVPPDHVAISGSVTGGKGGNGADATQVLSGLSRSGTGGTGGNGGSVNIAVSNLADISITGTVKGGDGGDGGQCYLTALSGTAVGQKGGSTTGQTGGGGNGGSVSTNVAPKAGTTTGGAGGASGAAYLYTGNGGPAGPGGDCSLTIKAPGVIGTGIIPGAPGGAGLLYVYFGQGGNSPDASTSGGPAGTITMNGVANPNRSVLVTGFTGGAGFSGCKKGANTAGSKGGAGATIVSNGISYSYSSPAFNGGNGGDGVPPGSGGSAGFDATKSIAVGVKGANGNTCTVASNTVQAPSGMWCNYANNTIYVAGALSDNVGEMTASVGSAARPVGLRAAAAPYGSYSLTSIIPAGSSPYALVGDGVNQLFVANGDGSLSVVNLTQNAVTATLAIGQRNTGTTAYDGDNGHVYVPNADGTVTIIDAVQDTVIKTLNVGPNAFGVQANSTTNRIYVSSATAGGAGEVSVIDGSSDTVVATIPLAAAGLGLDLDSIANTVYVVTGNTVAVIAGSSNTITAASTIDAGVQPEFIACAPLLGKVYVADYAGNQVSIMSETNNSLLATVPTGNNPAGLGLFPAGPIYVPNFTDSTVTFIDGSTNVIIGTANLAL